MWNGHSVPTQLLDANRHAPACTERCHPQSSSSSSSIESKVSGSCTTGSKLSPMHGVSAAACEMPCLFALAASSFFCSSANLEARSLPGSGSFKCSSRGAVEAG
eukprot:TRINITY_DN6771_c0_g1_i1.p2 TRINITY_DN6771_c0_g1~~TRINITY_DN6771_c0_g1_i1.p2  ORF type:complete len:104 (-),score=3.98 TRINITY_DN6771_c0_g1_i1:197-508(-)